MTDWDISGKRVLVTGGTSGIGLATVVELVRRGALVTLTTRDDAKGVAAAAAVADATGGAVEVRDLALHSLDAIRSFVDAYSHERLDVLVNNAGVYVGGRRETPDGFEWTMGVNHFGPFLLTNLLLEGPMAGHPSRVINVSSQNHLTAKSGLDFDDLQMEQGYSPSKAYAASKLANILFAVELDRRFADKGVMARALHPGVIGTSFASGPEGSRSMAMTMKVLRRFFKPPERGAETSVLLATAPEADLGSSLYWSEGKPKVPSAAAQDAEAARRLWEESARLVGF